MWLIDKIRTIQSGNPFIVGIQLDAFRLRSSQMARQVIIDIDIGIDSHEGKVPIPHEES